MLRVAFAIFLTSSDIPVVSFPRTKRLVFVNTKFLIEFFEFEHSAITSRSFFLASTRASETFLQMSIFDLKIEPALALIASGERFFNVLALIRIPSLINEEEV